MWRNDDSPRNSPSTFKPGQQPQPPISASVSLRPPQHSFDEVVTQSTIDFMGKAKAANKPFFVWMNTTRAHVLTHLSPKYEAMRNPKSGWVKKKPP